ncbi:SPOCS domain-containing protein [Phosphitispora sp. TUW77]|uniref:SPOCS domain-containing protein n=1 Tax=Phosphitispora sp. TUW77 TaxID=3152361 RepID=UPI003AB915C7
MPTFTGIYQEIAIDHQLVIPEIKPPAECILDVIINFDITKAVVIDTPLLYPEDPNLELQKVLVVGTAKIIVKYAADVPDQQVHAAHFDVPFHALIEWPDGPPQGTPICVEPVIEKSRFCLIDGRHIFKIIVVRLDIYTP